MRFNPNAKLDSGNVRGGSGGGGRRGGGVAIGGGIGGLVLLVVILLLGGDPSMLGGGSPQPQSQPRSDSNPLAHCDEVSDIESSPECRWVAYQNSLDGYWTAALEGYQPATFIPFSGSVSTGCGQATSDVGPFYCPADEGVYIDESFFQVLERQFGAQGTLAVEAYVMAHEYGHHVQNQIGVLQRSQQGGTGDGSNIVRSELQADCFAGVWFANATEDPQGPIAEITEQDLLEARSAAQAIGDDHIQENTSGRVDRESWTHGSSAQREKWLTTGFHTGDPNACDTWSASQEELG